MSPITLQVLLVEDSEDDAVLLLRQLAKGGFEVVHERVQTPEALIEALDSGHWDIVISDYNMPSFNGLAALKILKGKNIDVPFIAISGAIGEESAVELLKSGAGDFIKKGNWARLVPAVHRELREARNRKEERRAQKARAVAEARYTNLFENAVEGIFQSTAEGRYINVNPAMARIYGYRSPEHMIAEISDIGRQLYVNPVKRLELLRHLKAQGSVSGFEVQMYRLDGKVIWVALHARAIFSEAGELTLLEGMLEDVSKRKRAEEQLMHNAFYDGLTGLPNRALFEDRLARALERYKRKRGEATYAVLFLDLDEFKTINDSLGHQAGDDLLVMVGNILTGCVRSLDTVARFGGDEFAVLLEDVGDFKEVMVVAQRIQADISKAHQVGGREVFTTASIGIVLGKDRFETSEEVLRDVDIAMYRAKALGRNRFKVFNERMGRQAVRRLELETDIRLAIRNEQFEVYYQPIISLEAGTPMGMEALIRWNHPQRGLVMPGEFIPLTEETGLVTTIGHWVLNVACGQTKVWQGEHPNHHELSISINLSGKQLHRPELIDQVRNVLADTGLDPGCVKLEITESVLMENARTVISRLERLKELGVQLAIDDFGTGYSSLAYLHQFPIDILKIDRSFIVRMGMSVKDTDIVRTIVALAHNMNMRVVAEGVETLEQATVLREMGCECAQGYLYSRPVPARRVPDLVVKGMDNLHPLP